MIAMTTTTMTLLVRKIPNVQTSSTIFPNFVPPAEGTICACLVTVSGFVSDDATRCDSQVAAAAMRIDL
jgi:hypothetical protein